MGGCASKPKVRGDDAPTRDEDPTSSSPTNLVRSTSDPPARNPPSIVTTENPPTTARVKENVEEDLPVSEDSSENFQPGLHSEPSKPEPAEARMDSTGAEAPPDPTKQEVPKPETPSKETEMKLLDSEIKLLESATRTLSKKAEQGDISLLPNHTPNASETKLLASLATPKSETSPDEPEIKLPVFEAKPTPELVKEEVPTDKNAKDSKSETEVRGTKVVSEPETRGAQRKGTESETMTEMSNVSSRQPSLDFLDASDKMVVDKGVLESMPMIPDTMKAELEKAVLEPIVSSKTVSDWNAKVEKAMEEPAMDSKTETNVTPEKHEKEKTVHVSGDTHGTMVGTKSHDPERGS